MGREAQLLSQRDEGILLREPMHLIHLIDQKPLPTVTEGVYHDIVQPFKMRAKLLSSSEIA